MSFEAGQTIKFPSPIDVHVHLREPGGEDKETIGSGTLAALHGGYQAVIDMPNNPAPYQTWSQARLDEKMEIAEAFSKTKIGFYAGVDLDNPAFEEIPAMVLSAMGLKLYMDHTTGNTTSRGLESVRKFVDEWIQIALMSDVKPPILLHAREGVAEETARYIARRGYPVHWCHISTKTEVDFARQLTLDFPQFYTGGVTPHHLTMTDRNADFQQGWNGARMQPPLGSAIDAEALLSAYNDSTIQILETDHAPHSNIDKLNAESENPEGKTDPDCKTCFGVSGIEFVLPVMMSLVQRKKIKMDRLVNSLYDQPVRMLGLDTSRDKSVTHLEIGPRILGINDCVGKSENHPYIGWTGWARVLGVDMNLEDCSKILRTGSVL